jgi:hypothetical protein
MGTGSLLAGFTHERARTEIIMMKMDKRMLSIDKFTKIKTVNCSHPC